VTVFHFYNPFLNQTLRTVLENIAQSLREAPRQADDPDGARYRIYVLDSRRT